MTLLHPSRLHAKGKCVEVHKLQYAIGRAGVMPLRSSKAVPRLLHGSDHRMLPTRVLSLSYSLS